ncbi:hypothetical protein WL883_26520, partial [Escherichia coli]
TVKHGCISIRRLHQHPPGAIEEHSGICLHAEHLAEMLVVDQNLVVILAVTEQLAPAVLATHLLCIYQHYVLDRL